MLTKPWMEPESEWMSFILSEHSFATYQDFRVCESSQIKQYLFWGGFSISNFFPPLPVLPGSPYKTVSPVLSGMLFMLLRFNICRSLAATGAFFISLVVVHRFRHTKYHVFECLLFALDLRGFRSLRVMPRYKLYVRKN